jgi:hypothetical protein
MFIEVDSCHIQLIESAMHPYVHVVSSAMLKIKFVLTAHLGSSVCAMTGISKHKNVTTATKIVLENISTRCPNSLTQVTR